MGTESSKQVSGESLQVVEPFAHVISQHGLELKRNKTTTLQINVGLLCNQSCRHCHLEAGPGCQEIMTAETVDAVVAFAQRGNFHIIDITGGAPEMNPHLSDMITRLTPLKSRIMLRSNLTALTEGKQDFLIDV